MSREKEAGQSLIEFLLMLPLLIGMVIILIRVNTAIQISIVDQQYARAQALFLTFNSPFYPKLNIQQVLGQSKINQMMVGVSDNVAPESGSYSPTATVQRITRTLANVGSDSPKEEPIQRGKVRIRNTVTLCTPTYYLASGPIVQLGGNPIGIVGVSNLNEGSRFNTFCEGYIKYEQ